MYSSVSFQLPSSRAPIIFPSQIHVLLFFFCIFFYLLNTISPTHIHTAMGSPTGAWAAYQWRYPQRKVTVPFQQTSTTNSCSTTSGVSGAPPSSMHADVVKWLDTEQMTTAAGGPCMQQLWHVQRMVFHSPFPFPSFKIHIFKILIRFLRKYFWQLGLGDEKSKELKQWFPRGNYL